MKKLTLNLPRLAANVAAVERMPHAPIDDGSHTPGRIVAANDSLFSQAHFNELLTGFAIDYRDPEATEEVLNRIIPAVPTGHWFTYTEHNNVEEFLSETDDLRALRADFGTVEYTGTKVTAQLENRGLKIILDADELIDNPNAEEQAVGRLLRRLSRNSLRRGLALLNAAATNDNATWNSGGNPDSDARTMLRTAADSSGIRPDQVVFGGSAWDLRMSAYEAQNNSGAAGAVTRDAKRLAEYLGVRSVEIVNARYQSSPTAKSALLGDTVLAYMASPGVSKEDPSNIKRFWAPCRPIGDLPGGQAVRVYRIQRGKLIEIVVEKYELIKVTSLLGIRKLTVAAA